MIEHAWIVGKNGFQKVPSFFTGSILRLLMRALSRDLAIVEYLQGGCSPVVVHTAHQIL